jgi:hypothetical protein
MARLFTSGFELNSLTAGVEFDTILSPGISIQAVTKRSGDYALKCLPVNNNGSVSYTHTALASGRTFYYRFYLNVHTRPPNNAYIASDHLTAAPGTMNWYIILASDGTLTLADGASNVITSKVLTNDQWYRIEISYAYTSKALALYVDGISIGSGTNVNSSVAANGYIVGSDLWSANNPASGEWYFDDLALNDDQGSYQNGFPGDGKVLCLRPNGAGDSAQWTRGGTDSGANWSQCNNTPPNDVTSYVYASTVNYLDMYACVDSGADANAVVKVVEVGGRYARSSATSPTFKFRIIKTGSGTESLSAAIVPNASTWKTNANSTPRTSPIVLYLDPDSSAWTKTTLDSMQIGVVETVDQTANVRLSDIWAMVDVAMAPWQGVAALSIAMNTPALLKLCAISGVATLETVTPAITLDVSGGATYNLSGTATVATSTATPALLKLDNISGVASAATVTNTPALRNLINLSGVVTVATATPTPALLLLKNISGVATGTTVTNTPALLRLCAQSGAATLATVTPAINLDGIGNIYNLSGTATLASITATPALLLLKALVGAGVVATITSSAALLNLMGLSGTVTGVTATNTPALLRLCAQAGVAAAVTITPAIELSITGVVNFAGLAAMQALTAALSLEVLRPLAGTTAGVTSTPSVSLLLLKALAGTISLDTATPAPGLKVLRALSGAGALVTITSQIEIGVFVPAPIIAGELSALIQSRLLSVVIERSPRLMAAPTCQQILMEIDYGAPLAAMPACRQITAALEN